MTSETTLELLFEGEQYFSSAGHWLHPLFELERYLREHPRDLSRGLLHDKVVGRGSAFLIVRLGIRRVHADLLSRLGKDVLDRAGVANSHDTLVEQIQCRTEEILRHVTEPEEAYALLAERAARAAPQKP